MSHREIKFRFWNIKCKRMVYTAGIGCIYEYLRDEYKHFDWRDTITLQYTGLKDKNGKEIYEGDILRQRRRNWTGKGVVVFDSGCYWFRRDIGKGQEELYIAITNDECEIIGNIENFEPLETKDV